MHFLINERSFLAQASNQHEANELMITIFEIITELEPIRGNDLIQVHSTFSIQEISSGYSIKDWVYQKLNSSTEKDIGLLFVTLMTKGPFIDKTLSERLTFHKCKFNGQDVMGSSLAGAAYLEGTLISLQNAPDFTAEQIQVQFGTNTIPDKTIEIVNLTNITHAQKLRPRYVPSAKHAQGGFGTFMDLSDEEAQKVLDNGIVSGKKIYGYHNDKFYAFQPDNFEGFHGYPVSRNEVPSKVIKKIESKRP